MIVSKRGLRLLSLVLFLLLTLGACVSPATPSQSPQDTAPTAQGAAAPTAAATQEPAFDPMGKYDAPVTVTTVKAISDSMQAYVDKKADVLTDNIWFNAYRDELGIEVQYLWTVPESQYEQKINAQIAANDLPDFYRVNNTQLKMLVGYEMVYDMTDVFEQYKHPFTQEMMEADNFVSIQQASSDGRLMALPHVNGNRDGSNMWWVRKDWMENLGIAEPANMAEFIEMCRRFTTDDPDGNGKNDTIGLGLANELFTGHIGLLAFAEGYHAYASGWVKTAEGKVAHGSIQPEMKQVLAELATLYKEGVIDKEFIVKNGSKVNEEIIAGKIGVLGGQHWQAFFPLQDAIMANPDADFIALPVLSADDKTAKTMVGGSAGNFYAVNSNCKNPEAVVKLYNYYYLKDPALSPEFDARFHGQPDSNPDNPLTEAYWWAAVQTFYPMQNMFIHMGVEKFFEENDQSQKENYWVKDNIEQVQMYKDGDRNRWSSYAWAGPGDYSGEGRVHFYDQNDRFLLNGYVGAPTDSMVQYNATLDQLMLESFTKIIMGETDVEAFDTYVDQWLKLGGEKITQEVNDSIQ